MEGESRAEKKRKGSNFGDRVANVKVEADHHDAAAAQVLIVAPPDESRLCPIRKILQVELWKDDSNAVQSALIQLLDLCRGVDENSCENRTLVLRLGGASKLTSVLRKWYWIPAIQAEGLVALQYASYHNAAFKKSAGFSGGLNAIIWAMENYPDNLRVQVSGCGALMSMLLVMVNADYFVNELKGIDWIIAAMNKYPEDVGLQQNACGALDSLTGWDEFKDPVKQAGGRRALLDAIENHQDESKEYVRDLQERANHALKALLP